MRNDEGILSIEDKIWFNTNEGRCLLRVCGFSKEQIEKMKKAKFIDITLVNVKDYKAEALIYISGSESD